MGLGYRIRAAHGAKRNKRVEGILSPSSCSTAFRALFQMKLVFPELEFVELPFSHPIYHQQYDFPNGLPKIHEHDGKPAQGFGLIYEGRLVCFYTYECDLGDGWEDFAVHKDSESTRQKALKMGANIIRYVFSN